MNFCNGLIIKFFSFLYLLLLVSCASSTGSRYGNEDKNNKSNSDTKTIENVSQSDLKEDFDITPYKTKIIIPEKKNCKI